MTPQMMSLKFHLPWPLKESNIEQYGVFSSNFLVILALLWFHWFFIRNSKKGLPPGRKALPLIGNLLPLDPELHTCFTTLSQTCGPICRLLLGKKVGIIIASPALACEVLKDKDTIFANRDVSAAGKELTYGGNDIVWTPYGHKWRILRKVCVQEMLSDSTLDSVYALRRRELRQSISYFYNKAGSPVNIGEQMFMTALNVTTRVLWGGTVKGEERASLGVEVRHVVTKMNELLGTPNVSVFYPGLAWFDLQGVRKKMKVLAKRFDKIFESMIDQRQKMDRNGVGQESKDFLQVLPKLKDEADAKMPLTMTEIKALLTVMVVGGTETTANTVEFAMAEIMNKPDVVRKLQQEVDTVVGKDNIVEESHIQRLPYFYAYERSLASISSSPTLDSSLS